MIATAQHTNRANTARELRYALESAIAQRDHLQSALKEASDLEAILILQAIEAAALQVNRLCVLASAVTK